MKHLKLFESFKEKDIHAICREYGIKNYTINEDGSIDVDGNAHLSFNKDLTKLPLKFRNVTGNFYCCDNELTSLEGCPESVGGGFYCHDNELTSLEGCPESVVKNFYCSVNKLTSLEGCPKSVGGNFGCHYNEIITFEHLPYSIGGYFDCRSNPIYEIWNLFRDYSKIEFLNDCDAIREPDNNSDKPIIILDRFNYFLEEIGKPTVTEVKGYKCI
jgi:hypothetical protein